MGEQIRLRFYQVGKCFVEQCSFIEPFPLSLAPSSFARADDIDGST
jgi:hypothetical protein